MSLKQSVVIVNEFTCKTSKGGTRGGTPGDYILRYMNRGGATEILTPVRLDDHQNYILYYMLRDAATESTDSVPDLKKSFRNIQKQGGKAFGYGDFSLSDEKLNVAAADVQKNFEAGKTVMKTILSFDEGYLRKYGIIEPDFDFHNEGDYRGHIDQLKLRMAIMNGMKKMSRGYDDLRYVGVIQVDTKHVHCHIAMFDNGHGTIMPDHTQRGKLTGSEKRDLRRGIDAFLDEKQYVKMMASDVEYNKKNTIGYIKRFTHKTMYNRGFMQFMIACLPEDKSMWRAGSNAKSMQKANNVVQEYVMQLLEQPDSGYQDAMQKVKEYASYRTKNEGLTGQNYRAFVKSGQEKIITDSMNAVYSVLKQIPDEDLAVRTPMLDAMSMSYEDMANTISDATDTSDSIAEFGFKLRSYKTRLDHHRSEFQKYHDARTEYEIQKNKNDVSSSSQPLLDFFKVEEEYNEMLMNKYQYFLNFIPPDKEYLDDFKELTEYSRKIMALQQMMADTDMKRMSSSTAESYGLRVYDQNDGQFMVTNPDFLSNKFSEMKMKYESMREAYRVKVAGYGFQLTDDDMLKRGKKYIFDDVKSLDIHHMIYDFPHDFAIPQVQSDSFVKMADNRYKAFQKAKGYLIASNQADMVQTLPESDIEMQHKFADRFRQKDAAYHTAREAIVTNSITPKSKTIRLDYDFYTQQEDDIKEDIKLVVKNAINALQYE